MATYPYGLMGVPAVGRGLPGLPRRAVASTESTDPYYDYVTLLVDPSATVDTSGSLKEKSKYANTITMRTDGVLDCGAYAENALRADDFCVEVWVNLATTGSICRMISNAVSAGLGGFILQSSGGNTTGYVNNTAMSLGAVPLGVWTHLCVLRLSGAVYAVNNGVKVAGPTANTDNLTSTQTYLGGSAGGNFFIGLWAGVRITKGVARYDPSGFTPPTLPLHTS